LNLQRRIHEARVGAVARSVGRRKGRWSRLGRVLGRVARADDASSFDLRDPGEDVWHALRC